MSGLDVLPQIAISLVILLVVSFIGIGIMDAATRSSGIDVPAKVAQTTNDAMGWLPMLILSVIGGLALVAVFAAAFNDDYSSPSTTNHPPRTEWKPEPTKTQSTRLYWDPYEQRIIPVVVPPRVSAPAAPAPTAPPEQTMDEIIARDPEIVMLNKDVRSIDTEINQLREQRKQILASRTWFERLVLRFKKPPTVTE